MKSKLLTCLLILFSSLSLMAQNVTVKGVVSDQIGPAIGVSVVEKARPMAPRPIWTESFS